MIKRLSVFVVVLAAACASEAEKKKERADEIEQLYKLATADARRLEGDQPVLLSKEARRTFEKVAERTGMDRLALDDVNAFVAFVGSETRDAIIEKLSPELVKRLRDAVEYEPRFREIGELASLEASRVSTLEAPNVVAAVKLIRESVPSRPRFPLAAIPAAVQLGAIEKNRLAGAVERFAFLEIDVGILELDPGALQLLAKLAGEPATLAALATLRRHLAAFEPRRATFAGLDVIAKVGSTALSTVLESVGRTRSFQGLATLEKSTAQAIAKLAERPASAALLPLFEDADEDFGFDRERDAAALVAIAAADPRARENIVTVLPSIQVQSLDAKTTALVVSLASDAALRDAARTIHGTWGRWRATSQDADGLRVLGKGPALGELPRALRRLGFELATGQLATPLAEELVAIVADGGSPLAESFHVVFPHITVKTLAQVNELRGLVRAKVTPEELLRLEYDSIKGSLDVERAAKILAAAHTRPG